MLGQIIVALNQSENLDDYQCIEDDGKLVKHLFDL